MQIFSNLQRKSVDVISLRYFCYAITLILYEMLSTAFLKFPPLFGVFFTYLIIIQSSSKLSGITLKWILAFIFLIFAGLLHGFLFLSCIFAYIGFYSMFYDWIVINIKSRLLLFFLFNASAYCGIWGVNNLILYILDENLLKFSSEIYNFIFIETIISAFVFRKNKL